MASVYRKKGRRNWTVCRYDHEGRRHERSSKTTCKATATRIANRRQDHVAQREQGLVDPRQDQFSGHERRPLTDHVQDYHNTLVDRGRDERYAGMTKTRLERVLTLCKAQRISDLTGSRVAAALAEISETASPQTVLHYHRAAKSFSKWLTQDGRAPSDPLAHLKGKTAQPQRRRRALTSDELNRLVRAAEQAGETVSIPHRYRTRKGKLKTGTRTVRVPDCGTLYLVAAEVGRKLAGRDTHSSQPPTEKPPDQTALT